MAEEMGSLLTDFGESRIQLFELFDGICLLDLIRSVFAEGLRSTFLRPEEQRICMIITYPTLFLSLQYFPLPTTRNVSFMAENAGKNEFLIGMAGFCDNFG